ncbi:unnamed protein product [Anisakis simplex]|uniref:G_PROTEIN_RECEP_F1_2 domain-containing protein n=1 Tax=Anisakis simplex TaxID=6269 RepID=A0A0M3K2B6_ANISI|nr:unnamed protein product [Anisakis simplex]
MAMNESALEQLCMEYGEAISEPNVTLGIIYIVSGIIYIALQLLCSCVISQKDLMVNSCFKLMLSMCILDVLTLMFTAIFSGFLSIIGASICVYPVMTSISGHIAFGMANVLL